MRVVVFDPGPHTGIAVWQKPHPFDRTQSEFFSAWETALWDGVQFAEEELLPGVDGYPPDVVVCESFQISVNTAKKSTAGSLQTIEVIGVLRYLARRAGVPFVLQAPSDAFSFGTREKLERLGWWTVGSDHARSATKHLVLYLVKSGLIPASRVIE